MEAVILLRRGLEPPRTNRPLAPQASVSTNSTTAADIDPNMNIVKKHISMVLSIYNFKSNHFTKYPAVQVGRFACTDMQGLLCRYEGLTAVITAESRYLTGLFVRSIEAGGGRFIYLCA